MVGTGIYVIGERTFYSSVKRDAEHPPPPAFTTLVERCTFALYPLFHDTLHSCFCTDLLICKNEKGQPNDFLILGDPRLTVRQKGWKKKLFSSIWGHDQRQAGWTRQVIRQTEVEPPMRNGARKGMYMRRGIWYQVAVFRGKRQLFAVFTYQDIF